MRAYEAFLNTIPDQNHRIQLQQLFQWIDETYPSLVCEIKWNQPMYLDHGTFIIGFSVSKGHFSVSVEKPTLEAFSDQILKAGYERTMMLFKIKWGQVVDYPLFAQMIETNRREKENCTSFWRIS